jgi:hypothetical protein
VISNGSTAPAAATASTTEIRTPIRFSYGEISNHFLRHWDAAIGTVVRKNNCSQVSSREYRCGELPAGRIESDGSKTLMTLSIPGLSGRRDGVYYSTETSSTRLILDRTQQEGYASIPLLDAKSMSSVNVSSALGDSVFLKLDPRGGDLMASLCLGIPGFQAKVPRFKIKGNVRKPIAFLPDLRSKVEIQVDAGAIRLGASKLCSMIEIYQLNSTRFGAQLKEMGSPEFEKVDLSGLRVKVESDVGGLWGFINSFTSLLGLDFESKIIEAVRQESLSLLKERMQLEAREIRSGDWLRKYIDQAHLQRILNQATEQLNRRLSQSEFADLEVQSMIRGSCALFAASAASAPLSLRSQFFKVCRSALQLSVAHFSEDQTSRRQGCHDYYFNPKESRWWATSCSIKSEVVARIRSYSGLSSLNDLTNCLLSSFNSGNLTQCQSFARSALEQFSRAAGTIDVGAIPTIGAPSPAELDRMGRFFQRSGVAIPAPSLIQSVWN